MRKGAQRPDRWKAEARKTLVRLLRRAPELFVDDHHFCRYARTLHNGFAANLFGVRFDEIAACPVHTQPLSFILTSPLYEVNGAPIVARCHSNAPSRRTSRRNSRTASPTGSRPRGTCRGSEWDSSKCIRPQALVSRARTSARFSTRQPTVRRSPTGFSIYIRFRQEPTGLIFGPLPRSRSNALKFCHALASYLRTMRTTCTFATVSSPEKAGVGGSIPSLATTRFNFGRARPSSTYPGG